MPYAINEGTRVFWTEEGSGEPLLLVMGHSLTHRMWYGAMPSLTDRFRVIRFDNRGVGESGSPQGPYTIEQMTADALAVMDAAGLESAHVYGVSMGGFIAQHLAIVAPQRVRSLVLGCTGILTPATFGGRRAPMLPYYIPRRLGLWLGAKLAKTSPPDLLAADLVVMREEKRTRHGLIGQAHAMLSYDNAGRSAGIAIPTLVIHGDLDTTLSIQGARDLAALIPGAELVVLEGAGHNFLTDKRSEANAAVRAFLDAQVDASV